MAAEKISTVSELRGSLAEGGPPPRLSVPLTALWWAAKDDWDKAHTLVQSDDGGQAAWVHAHLHRVEGDLSNAAYWYRRAGREPASTSLESEWTEIVASLLDEDG